LLSLKAGGSGLNLTGADAVIHLDPWWNPAVEDHTTDRTRRVGQQRPVTAIRFITQSTIEEAVIGLHESKRALAEALLDGTETASRLSPAELVDLIRRGGGAGEPGEAVDSAQPESDQTATAEPSAQLTVFARHTSRDRE
jgi:SNF2 family DNA or RNA helicase